MAGCTRLIKGTLGWSVGKSGREGTEVVGDGRGEGGLAGRFILSLCGPTNQKCRGNTNCRTKEQKERHGPTFWVPAGVKIDRCPAFLLCS